MVDKDVIVIGAGWSGLLACKCMLEEGLTVVALEKRDTIGGIWCYSDDPDTVTVMRNTKCTSSSSVTEMSDFPMPDEIGMFPKQSDVFAYLKSYCDAFKLWPHVLLGHGVKRAEKRDGAWHVECENGKALTSKFLIVSTGVHQQPVRDLETTLLQDFAGVLYHSSELKHFVPEHEGKRVMIVGGGETASDIVDEWNGRVEKIVWCIPRGMHFFRKYAKLLPSKKPQALDKASSRMMKMIAPYTKSKPGLAWVCKWSTAGSLLAYQGHGIPEWKNDADFFHFFINKNGHILDLVDYVHVIPKGAIEGADNKTIFFTDGSKEEVDIVIQCTGYNPGFPFLPEKYARVPVCDNFKFVFNTDDPSLVFIGYARPVVGSIPGLAELQARWVGKVYSGKYGLPPEDDMRIEAEKDKNFWRDYFKHTSHRLGTLVEAFTYGEDVAKRCGIFPDYWALLKSDPGEGIMALLAPHCGSVSRLNEPEHRPKALANMRKHTTGTLAPTVLLLVAFLRLTWFDWWLDRIASIKYRIQVSSWWKLIRDYGVVRYVDWAWQTPKRWLFDNKTRA